MLINFTVKFKLPIIGFLPIPRLGERIIDVILSELGTTQNSHDLYDRTSKFEVIFNDSDETVMLMMATLIWIRTALSLSPKEVAPEMLPKICTIFSYFI